MTISDTGVVDMIGYHEASQVCTLGITDHLDWTKSDEHLSILQDKLNAYINYIALGNAAEYCQPHTVRMYKILIYAKHHQPIIAEQFMHIFQVQLSEIGEKIVLEVKEGE